uniref:Uncharacterized protein n=1 Tax=Spongospora subterranea TaxID=70186 RepID=A0A0H5QTF0_9EUKA|eukprot:CRZ05007.1 hypothetical protein [Spongospora subterranea]
MSSCAFPIFEAPAFEYNLKPMEQQTPIFRPPTSEQPIIYAKPWFALPESDHQDFVPESSLSIDALTARLQQLQMKQMKAKVTACQDEDDDFEANFGKELTFLFDQLRLRNLDVHEQAFMPYIY